MPIYDYNCPSCGTDNDVLLSYEEYEAIDEVECKECGTGMTRKDRVLGIGLKTTVRGVRKGHYNSGDYS